MLVERSRTRAECIAEADVEGIVVLDSLGDDLAVDGVAGIGGAWITTGLGSISGV